MKKNYIAFVIGTLLCLTFMVTTVNAVTVVKSIVKVKSVKLSKTKAINSPLFKRLRDNDVLIEEHAGGCVLFEKEEKVRSFL